MGVAARLSLYLKRRRASRLELPHGHRSGLGLRAAARQPLKCSSAGLLVFGCMPTTLSSGVALTQVQVRCGPHAWHVASDEVLETGLSMGGCVL
jgi:hypothetical protein